MQLLIDIADAVIMGHPKAATALPDKDLLIVHTLVAQKANGENKRALLKYLQALPRFHRGMFWKALCKRQDWLVKWYHNSTALSDLICNALFCCLEFQQGTPHKIQQPVIEFQAKCRSLDAVLNA